MVDFADSLRESIPTVMRALAQASNTGVLHVRGRDSEAEFRFFRGEITSARANSSRPLGEALAERGAISQSDLSGVLALQRRKKNRQPMATILVELGPPMYRMARCRGEAFHFGLDLRLSRFETVGECHPEGGGAQR